MHPTGSGSLFLSIVFWLSSRSAFLNFFRTTSAMKCKLSATLFVPDFYSLVASVFYWLPAPYESAKIFTVPIYSLFFSRFLQTFHDLARASALLKIWCTVLLHVRSSLHRCLWACQLQDAVLALFDSSKLRRRPSLRAISQTRAVVGLSPDCCPWPMARRFWVNRPS